ARVYRLLAAHHTATPPLARRSTSPTDFLLFFFYCYRTHRDLHSFPTRRSSDLPARRSMSWSRRGNRASARIEGPGRTTRSWRARSEEHTSELQSRFDLVCRLLLEKKKK